MLRHLLLLLFALFLLGPLSLYRSAQTSVPQRETAQISHALGVSVSAGTVTSSQDSHGALGDGLTFITLSFPDDGFGRSIQDTWTPLPLTGNLRALLYGSPGAGPYITDQEGAACFPQVENGYYYFEDRHAQSTDPHSDFALFRRSSFNLTTALYDADTQTLYFCKFDT